MLKPINTLFFLFSFLVTSQAQSDSTKALQIEAMPARNIPLVGVKPLTSVDYKYVRVRGCCSGGRITSIPRTRPSKKSAGHQQHYFSDNVRTTIVRFD